MNRQQHPSNVWYSALTLSERITLQGSDRCERSNINSAFARGLIEHWKSQPPFDSGEFFEERLAIEGITEEELSCIVGEPYEVNYRIKSRPSWMAELDRVFDESAFNDGMPVVIPTALRDRAQSSFLRTFEPLINPRRQRLRRGLQSLTTRVPHPPFDPDVIEESLAAHIQPQLIGAIMPTMVLELNAARLQGLLRGETPQERFQDFLEQICQRDKALAILVEYPVLARQLISLIDKWVDSSLEFMDRLCADWIALKNRFSPGSDPGMLSELKAGMGDNHRGGRTVVIAKFSSGHQIVYKPRSLAVDLHFQELLWWLNERGHHPPFSMLKVLDRGEYGWVEFVAARSCSSVEEVRRFYERQGGYLALLFAVEAVDFHFENLIAAGDQPVLIDLESLFHPRPEEVDLGQSDLLAGDILGHSVFRVGLLPRRHWASAKSDGIDLSGLGGVAGQLFPFEIPCWEKSGSDQMHLGRQKAVMPGRDNRPRLHGEDVDLLNYTDEIIKGFADTYRLLLEHRDELLSPEGPLARFVGDEARVILRPTRLYALLLTDSYHPDLLRNALDRDRYFDRLWLGNQRNPHLIKAVAAEHEDLVNGDIPMFTTQPGSRDLWTSCNLRIPDFFKESGMDLVRRRVSQLSETDLTQQLWFIRAALATASAGTGHMKKPVAHLDASDMPPDRESLLNAARAVGDRLEMLAIRGTSDVNWIGLTLARDRNWSVAPLGWDLYNGLPGIAMFLAYLGAITGEERYTDLARDALAASRRQVEQSNPYIRSIGFFDGWSGLLYVLSHLGVLWEDPRLFSEADRIVDLLPPLIAQDEQFDIASGAAGCIGGLLSLYSCGISGGALSAAIGCGDHLVRHARAMERGVGWMPLAMPGRPLAGFAHGVAGISWALLQLGGLTGQKRFKQTARAAIDYERSLIAADEENWLDLRQIPAERKGQNSCMTAWCHGAPGIGIARLNSLRYLDNTDIRDDIEMALKTTVARGFGDNHSLCHGDLGNLELLLQAKHARAYSQSVGRLGGIAASVLQSIRSNGWLCGVPLGVESPGLMTGLAGIGFGLLRLAEPLQVPSVLALATPRPILPVFGSAAQRGFQRPDRLSPR